MSYTLPRAADLSPVALSYVAALRGVVPRKAGTPFTFAQIGAYNPEDLLCLAASNPEGRFFGLLADSKTATEASILAAAKQVWNISFGTAPTILPEQLNYLCLTPAGGLMTAEERAELFALAETRLAPGGILSVSLKPCANADETLRFLLSEYAPELTEAQVLPFLRDLKILGQRYFAEHPIAAAALDRALDAGKPETFFEACKGREEPVSGTFETMAGLLPRQFAFAGDAEIGANYLELSAPAATHETLLKTRDHLLYESIKDFVLQRPMRHDIWVKLPADQTLEKPVLFGYFTFGITAQREKIPAQIAMDDRSVDLTTPLFKSLIDLMCVLPMGIGDFLQHPTGKMFDSDDVLSALQILVAAGIARPMRGRYEGKVSGDLERPVWSNGFNEHLKNIEITEAVVCLSSPIIGGPLAVPARDALVMQALSRVGMANVSGSLMPELQKLCQKNPALAAQIMDSPTPTDESVHTMVVDVIERGMVRWYAYGLLAA